MNQNQNDIFDEILMSLPSIFVSKSIRGQKVKGSVGVPPRRR